MLIVSVVTGWFSYYLNAYYSGPYLKYSVLEQIRDILPSLLLAFGMAIVVYIIGWLPLSPYIVLPMQIACGAIIVFSICELTKMEEYIQIKNIAFGLIPNRK